MRNEGRGPIPLDAVRNMLLPIIKHMQALHPGRTLTITCDEKNDVLRVEMKDEKSERKIGFAITRAEIIARAYMQSFQPNVVGLLNALNLPQEVFDQMYPPEKTLEQAIEQNRAPPVTGGSEDRVDPNPEEPFPGWDIFVHGGGSDPGPDHSSGGE